MRITDIISINISVLYSYFFYKKKIETGEKLKIQYKKKAIVGYGIVTILTIIFIIGSLFWGSIDIQFQDNSFTIKAQGWSDYTVDYTKIDSISYEENLFQNSNDYRINGFGKIHSSCRDRKLEDYRRDRNSFSERSRYCAGSRYRTIDRECEAGFRR